MFEVNIEEMGPVSMQLVDLYVLVHKAQAEPDWAAGL
jgi:hypothetical protein